MKGKKDKIEKCKGWMLADRAHIEQANRAISEFMDVTPLVFKAAEVWRSEIEANDRVLDALQYSAAVLARAHFRATHAL